MEQEPTGEKRLSFIQRCKLLGRQVLAVISRQTPAFAPPQAPPPEADPQRVRVLPTVSEETVLSTSADMGDSAYYDRAGDKLLTQQSILNRHLGDFISRKADTPAERTKMVEAALVVYDALARQAEANAMNERF